MALVLGFEMRGDNPVGLWSGDTLPASNVQECTKANQVDWEEGGGAFFPATKTSRWTFIAGVLTAIVDARPVGTWKHTPGSGVQDGDGNWVFDLEVGDPEPSVTLSLTVKVTRDELIELEPSGHQLHLALSAGDVTLAIATDKPTEWEVNRVGKYFLANKLIVRVGSTKLYAV